MSELIPESVLVCPVCGFAKRETMPTDSCQFFYKCISCKTLLRPKSGDCCVFCSYVNRLKGCDSGPHELYNGESQAVKAWLIERAKMEPPADCDTLFISERRKPLSRCTVWLMIGDTAKAAGLEHLQVHPHMLRHSTGYNLVNKGTDIRIIQGYLGHRSIRARFVTPSWTASVLLTYFSYAANLHPGVC